jgi:dienelactone hydrolase
VKFLLGIFLILLFLGTLFWAKVQDPFSREWFTLQTDGFGSFQCVAVMPKPVRPCPVIIYAHESTGSLLLDGYEVRQMSELGLAVVGLEYNQTNPAAFAPQMEAVLRHLGQQKWADTNAIVWLGFSLGANRMMDFVLDQPAQQPQLLIQLAGAGLPEGQINNRLELLRCPVLLVHGEQDDIFPLADTKRMAAVLQSSGVLVNLKTLSGLPHGMEPNRGVVFRCLGEYCRSHLVGTNVWQNYQSIAQWQAGAPTLWLFCLPALAWMIGGFVWQHTRRGASLEKIKRTRYEIALRWLTILLVTWALAETAIHLVSPRFLVSERTLGIARRCLVQPKERADFEFLSMQPIWQGQKLRTLLDHVELAGYNRELINWQLDGKIYRDFVLSPIIMGNLNEQLNWRRPLWEEFYPRIRHESSPENAVKIVVCHLRERVTIATLPKPPREVPDIWLKQITDETGFEIIYVAALRSVGVPARLDSNGRAEFWDGNRWQTAPPPAVINW